MGACPSAIRIYSIYTIFVWQPKPDIAKSLVNRGWHGFCYFANLDERRPIALSGNYG